MKFYKSLIFTLLFSSSLFSQSKEALEIKNLYWGDNDTQKNNVDIPVEWENESAVILYQEYFYDYHKYGKKVKYINAIRKRVKLLDNASIKEYSEFSFVKSFRVARGYWGKKGKKHLGIKIIKPDGTEKEIEIDKEAVETDNYNEYKIAISGLEVGDIIDYYSYTIEPFKQKSGYTFKSIERPLIDIYPTKEFVLRFNTENDFFINFNTYNGAPKLKEIETDKSNDRRYVLKANNLKKSEFPRWSAPFKELPFFKFQVIFARNGSYENSIFDFLSDDEKDIKKSVSKEDVLKLYDNHYGIFKYYDKAQSKYFKDKKLSNEELVMELYYYLRHHHRNQFIQPVIIRESDIVFNSFHHYGTRISFIDTNYKFIKAFASTLIDKEIPFDVIVTKNRDDGDIEDLLFSSEMNTILRVNLDTPLYISIFDSHSTLSSMNPLIESSKAYALSYSYEKKRLDAVEEITIPSSSYVDNESLEELNVNLKEDFSGIKINRMSKHTGHNKTFKQEDLLYFFDFLDEEYSKGKTKNFFERLKNKKNKIKAKKEYDALVEKLKKKQKEHFKKTVESEYDMGIENHTFEFHEMGRYSGDSSFAFKDEFEINEGLIKKAGPNYIIQIGKLIGGQVDITEKERTREENIYFRNPRSYRNVIKLTIPEGYKVVGLDKLKKTIDNPTGAFFSSAEIDGDILTITTSKAYKNNFEPNANWNSILDFLDAAYQFTNEKILLKKG